MCEDFESQFCPDCDEELTYENYCDDCDKTWAAMVLEDNEYKKEKKYTVTYVNTLDKVDQVEVFATDKEDAKEKIGQYRHLKVLSAEELQEVGDHESDS